MTKEQFLKLAAEAYDKGANFSITFHDHRAEEMAADLAEDLTKGYGIAFKDHKYRDTESCWKKYQSEDCQVECIIFYNKEDEQLAV
ncbi:hypothetical protein FZC79_10245 [Rossellomorea vietnamensis]|uniref:Uncharacterized protein n=1 Tax=Rossellomorea vietnamensis TaxID=218284 RepID=A0A5D4KED9_9BACI|nr:hypothetical protein [Rossellomorea vietnamensis]TYR75542.1 hypothetical protein FZC79_10245 [Rossellomorea vietnamensis]